MTEFLVSAAFLSGAGGFVAGIMFGGVVRRSVGRFMVWAGEKVKGA